jgi:hypothetical protein
MKLRIAGILLLLLIYGCGPTEEQKNQAALEVYEAYKLKIKAKHDAMHAAFKRAARLTADEVAEPLDLKDKPAIDITTYPQNGILAMSIDDIEARFISVNSLKGGFEIHRSDTLEDIKRNGENIVKSLLRIRYLGVIKILKMTEPKTTGNNKYRKDGITVEFIPGEATARVFVFDLTSGDYMGSSFLQARNSKKIKLRPTEFMEQLKFDLRQKIKEAAVTNLQFWDEVNRKKQ